MTPPHVVVVGSINMDLVARVPQLPRPGQTVQAFDFRQIPGGKGANQAVAAARLGARCSMVGRVGEDAFGDELIQSLHGSGVEIGRIERTPRCSSGLALIGVDQSGENAITIVAGANGHVTPEDVADAEEIIASADAVLLQLEIPVAAVETAIRLARHHQVLTVLDPAPATENLPPELLAVDAVCPNEVEAAILTGMALDGMQEIERAARELQRLGARNAVITLGERGAFLCDEQGFCDFVPAFPVRAVDTTAAGDAFAAALALALVETKGLSTAVYFACAAGALAATRPGAQPAMPNRAEVEQFLNERDPPTGKRPT